MTDELNLTTQRQQRELIEELDDYEGQNIGIYTLGGWLIGGQLGNVDNCVAVTSNGTSAAPPLIVIGTLNIFGPAFPAGTLPLVGTFRAWTNLKALVQVLVP